ncbi:MAG: hypothetical protein KC619_12060 [Myxococcales bacterium]|nr:hypothetical protein [Myxococcales bacterium]
MQKHRVASLLGLFVMVGCASGEEEIRDAVETHISGDITAMSGDPAALDTYLCRRGDASAGVYSLRSFEGRMCDTQVFPGLDLVGAAALLVCWDANLEGFQTSHCAENALEELGLTTYDHDAVVDVLIARLDAYAADAGGPAYEVAKLLLCAMPSSLFGPAAESHATWCAL